MGAAVTLIVGVVLVFVVKAVFTYFRIDEQKVNEWVDNH
jgi:hypothetical protein